MSDKFAYRSPRNNLFLRFAYPQVKKNSAKSGRASLTRGFDNSDFTSKILVFWISGRTGRLNSIDFPSCLTEIQQNLLIRHVGFVVWSLGECGRVHDIISN